MKGGDGAHLSVGAERALQTVLGGKKQPDQAERDTPAEVRERVLAAMARGVPQGYGDCADIVAGMVLTYLERYPDQIDRDAGGSGEGTLYGDVNAMTDGALSALGITGFQWGWAVNAARFVLAAPPVANPAIIEVRP